MPTAEPPAPHAQPPSATRTASRSERAAAARAEFHAWFTNKVHRALKANSALILLGTPFRHTDDGLFYPNWVQPNTVKLSLSSQDVSRTRALLEADLDDLCEKHGLAVPQARAVQQFALIVLVVNYRQQTSGTPWGALDVQGRRLMRAMSPKARALLCDPLRFYFS